MKDIKTVEEFYDTTNYEVELWDAEQQKNGVSCNQLMRFAQQYAEYYHKAKVNAISDEEIGKEFPEKTSNGRLLDYNLTRIEGAKWLKNKLLNDL